MAWPAATGNAPRRDSRVQELVVGDGVHIVLSRFEEREALHFAHEEPHDVTALAIHLKGGASFQWDRSNFTTRPHDIWAGSAPRGAQSRFRFPPSGFETVSLRMSTEAASDGRFAEGRLSALLAPVAYVAGEEAAARWLGTARPQAALIARAMLVSTDADAGQALFLETCVHALLAALPGADGAEVPFKDMVTIPIRAVPYGTKL
jgi:hypothetical protein